MRLEYDISRVSCRLLRGPLPHRGCPGGAEGEGEGEGGGDEVEEGGGGEGAGEDGGRQQWDGSGLASDVWRVRGLAAVSGSRRLPLPPPRHVLLLVVRWRRRRRGGRRRSRGAPLRFVFLLLGSLFHCSWPAPTLVYIFKNIGPGFLAVVSKVAFGEWAFGESRRREASKVRGL